jgi:hypothetical protein
LLWLGIPKRFWIEVERLGTLVSFLTLEQRWRYHNTRFQTILHNHSNKNSMIPVQNTYEDQWNRIELNINPCSYAHLIFDKSPKTWNGEKTTSSINVARKTGHLP